MERKRARGLDRAVEICDLLARACRPMPPAEIARAIGAPRSSVYELCATMTGLGLLEADARGMLYLGRKTHFWGRSYLAGFDLAREAQPVLDALTAQTGETSQLCVIDGRKYTVLLMREADRAFRISGDVGEPTPIPWTASGRLLLQHLTDHEILALIPPEDFRQPGGETLSPAQFLLELRAAASEGFFSFDSPSDSYTHCFAAAVTGERGACVATLCLVAPREEARARHAALKASLIQHAARLSERLAGIHGAGSLTA